MAHHRKAQLIVVSSVLSLLILGGAAWWKSRPLHADTPQELLKNGFVRVNRSDVVYRYTNNIGWEALRVQMQLKNANPREIDGVLKTAKRIVALPSQENSFTFPLRPVLASEVYLQGEKVWLIEAAAPPKRLYGWCSFGMTPQQIQEYIKRKPEMCIHRIVFVSAQKPYRAISPYGTQLNYKTNLFTEMYQ